MAVIDSNFILLFVGTGGAVDEVDATSIEGDTDEVDVTSTGGAMDEVDVISVAIVVIEDSPVGRKRISVMGCKCC